MIDVMEEDPDAARIARWEVLTDIEIYEDTLDCVYASWAAARALAWRNRSRPIDMGGPRHRWIERSEWDLH